MLACARIGAPHSVIFGGFSAEALSEPHPRRRRPLRDHRRRRLPARAPPRRSSRMSTCALEQCPDVRTVLVVRRTGERSTGSRVATTGGTTCRRPVDRAHGRVLRLPSTRSTSCTRAGRRPSPRASSTRPAATSCTRSTTHRLRLRHQARDRRVLDRRGHRLGDRPQLHRLRPARQRRHLGHLRGHARRRRPRPVVADRRGVQGQILYTAPTTIRTLMKWGEELPGGARPVEPARSSDRWASRSTPRPGCGTAAMSGGDRCPDRRHVVADRDRRHHDHAVARDHRRPSPVRR